MPPSEPVISVLARGEGVELVEDQPLADRAELLSRFVQANPQIVDLGFGEEHRLTLCRAYAKIEPCQTPLLQR